ncbi:MAG TPA: hypothetical protein PKX71_07160 [Candidatus Avimonas sp.]|nr:hypothetical protein [Clostridiales bacterium]HOB37325.1 hypothetical protein [Candidatus Avimonas sp.]HQA16715.1 hypothetical protein [Candidatus Avimonas sp.]HQD38787.1 hypothetical protein [Candidatus Avimonas sp.]
MDKIPTGFTLRSAYLVRITLNSDVYCADDFRLTEIMYSTPLVAMGKCVGELSVGYLKDFSDSGELLADEIKLLDTIALRIAKSVVEHQ